MVDGITLFVYGIGAFFWVVCAALAAIQLYITVYTPRRDSAGAFLMGLPAYAICSVQALASEHLYYIWSASFITGVYVTTSVVMIARRPE